MKVEVYSVVAEMEETGMTGYSAKRDGEIYTAYRGWSGLEQLGACNVTVRSSRFARGELVDGTLV